MVEKNLDEIGAQENLRTTCEICNAEANLTEFREKYICDDCIMLIKSMMEKEEE